MARSDIVVGFDLGHGETALAIARVTASTTPAVVDLPGATRRQHVTAVAESSAGDVIIGEEAMRTPHVRRLWFGFKCPRFDDPQTRTPMLAFVRRIVSDLVDNGTISDPAKLNWVFGMPSGWTAEHRRKYTALLKEAGLPNATVIAESRAALLYARDSGEVAVSDQRILQQVLIVDIGSSTTDYTHVRELSERAVDHGNVDLGASLIDKQIAQLAIDRHPDGAQFRDLLAIDPHADRKLELACRETKETFFRTRRAELLARNARVGSLYPVELSSGEEKVLDLRLSVADMDAVLDAPQSTLGNRSWREAFRADVRRAISAVPGKVDLILLTGGPSRMPFVLETCVKLVGAERVALGAEPESAIARGLALAGRTSLRSRGFRGDLAKVAPKIRPIVEAKIPDLAHAVGETVAKNMTERHVIPAFLAWRANRIRTLDDMISTVVKGVNEDLDPARNTVLTEVTTEWQNKLRAELDNVTRPVCNRWHIEPSAMSLPPISVTTPGQVTNVIDTGGMTRNINNAANAINALVAAVVAMVLFGAGTALIATTGPVGVVVAFMVGVGVLTVGKEEMMEKIKTVDIWPAARKLSREKTVLADLRAKAANNEAELAQNLAGELAASFAEQLTGQITKDITAELATAADRAELLIK
jgi:hypothetical protein